MKNINLVGKIFHETNVNKFEESILCLSCSTENDWIINHSITFNSNNLQEEEVGQFNVFSSALRCFIISSTNTETKEIYLWA